MKWLDDQIKRIISEKVSNETYDLLYKLNGNISVLNINLSKIIDNCSDVYKKENLELKKKIAKMEGDNV